jgi:hypothetical protein
MGKSWNFQTYTLAKKMQGRNTIWNPKEYQQNTINKDQ